MDCIMKKLKNEVGIYKITNLSNSKCYIGQSTELRKRYRSHKNLLLNNSHPNTHLQNSFNKGDKFVFEVLELCIEAELNEREIMWIEFFDSRNREFGYNFDIGGNVTRNRHPETTKKQSLRMIEYFSDESKRIELSIKRSEVPLEIVAEIKRVLSQDLEIEHSKVAERLDTNINSVVHISRLDSHGYVLNELNYIVSNRKAILLKRQNRKIISLYRDGLSYKQISESIGIHERNIILRVNEIKTKHDDRCRLNSINRSICKRNSLIKTLRSMNKNTVQINRLLKVSRDTISKVLKDKTELFTHVSQTRGKYQLNYK